MLTDSYYCFSYISKSDPNKSGVFICGKDSGQDFLALLGHPWVPRFDPLIDDGNDRNVLSDHSEQHNESNLRAWNPVAKQLWDALNLMIVCWNEPPQTPSADIKAMLEKYPDKHPTIQQLKAVNRMIDTGFKIRKFGQEIEKLRRNNPRLRQYKFDLLNQALASENIKSNFPGAT